MYENQRKRCEMLQVYFLQVQSRTTAECVERYYHVVKRNRRQSRVPRRYRDQETDQFATLLADSLREKSSPSSQSSSDEEITSKSKVRRLLLSMTIHFPLRRASPITYDSAAFRDAGLTLKEYWLQVATVALSFGRCVLQKKSARLSPN